MDKGKVRQNDNLSMNYKLEHSVFYMYCISCNYEGNVFFFFVSLPSKRFYKLDVYSREKMVEREREKEIEIRVKHLTGQKFFRGNTKLKGLFK